MSIFKVLETNITKSAENFATYLSDKTGDILKGSEFMLFGLTNIFKEKDIVEVETGLVDASYRGEKHDFGIDAIYITGSGEFIEQLEELDDFNDDTKFIIHVFQFKRGSGVAQADLLKLNSGIKKVLVDENISESDNLYFHTRMNGLNEIKNKLFETFSSDNICVNVHIVFGGIKKNLEAESILTDELTKIENTLRENGFTNAKTLITDCEELINSPSKSGQVVDIIEYQKTFKYITDVNEKSKLNGYLSILKGREIAELVRKHQNIIFEANIRDYYKRNDLNSKITETSASEEEAKFFWSYNNGITMTCSKVEDMPNNRYKLHNLQIVNGCQTSNAIYAAVKNKERVKELTEKKQALTEAGKEMTKKDQTELEQKSKLQFCEETSLLVKIIETHDEELVYRITETTNSQTPIKAFSLRANDDIQKLIEKYFESNNVSYERRINSLRNKGKKNIYSIQRLFQLYTSQILIKPSQVKTRPKDMFLNTYDDVFPPSDVKIMNYAVYLIPIKVDIALNRGLMEYLAKNPKLDSYHRTLISYGKLHLGVFILSSILKNECDQKGIVKKEKYIIKELESNVENHLIDAIKNFKNILKTVGATTTDSIPSAVKKTELDNKIIRFVKNRK